ncbi:MAG: LCP family protein [Chloroflexaceae bacterium]|nr:LCP family protein [Chloroflexaceae bacterium]
MRTGVALSGVAALSAAAGAWLAISLAATPLRQVELSPEEAAVFSLEEAVSRSSLQVPELTRPVNILVLGTKVLTSDVNSAASQELGYHALVDSFEGQADTMLLVRFDPQDQELTALSIPRDTKVEIEDRGTSKINAANYIGGPALAAQTVSNLLGDPPIDRYVRVNVQGVEKLIDALGGVSLYVPTDMKYQDDSQHLYINLKQGYQHLDGEKAVQFLRFRHDGFGDIGRVQRQQLLMGAIKEQALKPSIIVRLPKIVAIIQSHIDTNLSVEEIIALVGFAAQQERSDVQMLMLPGDFNGNGSQGISYWLPNGDRIEALMAQYFDEGYSELSLSDPSQIRLYIQDSTGDEAAVQAMTRSLQQAGYTRIFAGNDWPEPLATTRIVAQQGDQGSAASVRAALGIGEVVVESTGALTSDVTIQLGQDWRQQQ